MNLNVLEYDVTFTVYTNSSPVSSHPHYLHPFLLACADDSLAMGTRNGEQLT